jgi:pimeloyl-ACP methyl ester carboxylesterase
MIFGPIARNLHLREQLRPRIEAMATRSPELLRDAIPTLFVIGDEDTSYPAFVSQALARIMPNAWVEQVPNTGHSVAYQRAEVFNRTEPCAEADDSIWRW